MRPAGLPAGAQTLRALQLHGRPGAQEPPEGIYGAKELDYMQRDQLPDKLMATPANRMSREEIDSFLARRQNGYLASQRPDGHVHLTPVWYWYEAGTVYFSLGAKRMHLTNLRGLPKATVMVEEDLRLAEGWRAGARAVMFAGSVAEVTDADITASYEAQMARKYLGEGADDPEFIESVEGDSFVMWALTPERIVSWDFTKA